MLAWYVYIWKGLCAVEGHRGRARHGIESKDWLVDW